MESLSAKQVRELKDLYKDVHKVEELIEDGAEINEFFDSLTEEEKKNIFQKIKDAFKPKPITIKTNDGGIITINPGSQQYKDIKSGKVTTYVGPSEGGGKTYDLTKGKGLNYSGVESQSSIDKRKLKSDEINADLKAASAADAAKKAKEEEEEKKRLAKIKAEKEAKAKEAYHNATKETDPSYKYIKSNEPFNRASKGLSPVKRSKVKSPMDELNPGRVKAQQIAKDRIASGKTIDQVKAENEAKMKANASALNKDFQLMKKGEITKQEFVKKYPKSNTAKDFNARKLPPKVTDYSSYDPYETVLGYVISEGHADTVEEAHYVMMQMDEDTIKTIIREQAPFGVNKSTYDMLNDPSFTGNPTSHFQNFKFKDKKNQEKYKDATKKLKIKVDPRINQMDDPKITTDK